MSRIPACFALADIARYNREPKRRGAGGLYLDQTRRKTSQPRCAPNRYNS
jgi:hypothetical protein